MENIEIPKLVNKSYKGAAIFVRIRNLQEFGGWKARGMVRYRSGHATIFQEYWNGNLYASYEEARDSTLKDGSRVIDALE